MYEDFIKIGGIEIRDLADQLSGVGTDPLDHNKRLSNETVTVVTRGVQSPKGKDEEPLALNELVVMRLCSGRRYRFAVVPVCQRVTMSGY